MDAVNASLTYSGRWRINAVECCQVCKVPVISEMLQCQAMQQAGQVHNGLCKPAGPTPGWMMWVYVTRQSASIHHQGLLVSMTCGLVSGRRVPAFVSKAASEAKNDGQHAVLPLAHRLLLHKHVRVCIAAGGTAHKLKKTAKTQYG